MAVDINKIKNKIFADKSKSMLSDNIIDLLNFRINEEEKSSRIYLAMHLWLEDKGYFNSSKLWKKYSEEELKHADWAREFLLSFNIKPETRPIDDVQNDFSGLDDIIHKTLEHEIVITNQCKDLSIAAFNEQDMLTFTLGQKYVAEQVEEIAKVHDLLNLLEVYGSEKLNLALLDHEIERFL